MAFEAQKTSFLYDLFYVKITSSQTQIVQLDVHHSWRIRCCNFYRESPYGQKIWRVSSLRGVFHQLSPNFGNSTLCIKYSSLLSSFPEILQTIVRYCLLLSSQIFVSFSQLKISETKLRIETKSSGLKQNWEIGVLWPFSIIHDLKN